MNKPSLNALSAAVYIALVASALYYFPKTSVEESVLAPIVMLSLFVLSAALMGYFFAYQPIRLLTEGKQREAVKFFFSTIAIFACITGAVVATLVFSGVRGSAVEGTTPIESGKV